MQEELLPDQSSMMINAQCTMQVELKANGRPEPILRTIWPPGLPPKAATPCGRHPIMTVR